MERLNTKEFSPAVGEIGTCQKRRRRVSRSRKPKPRRPAYVKVHLRHLLPVVPDGCRKVNLSHGLYAIIDEQDHPTVKGTSWHAKLMGNHAYAVSEALGTSLQRHVLNAPKGSLVIHLNGNGLDCRRANLRLCTGQKQRVRVRQKKSQYRGVTKDGNRWRAQVFAQIRGSGKSVRVIGIQCASELEAAHAYDLIVLAIHKGAARLNFPNDPFGYFDMHRQPRTAEPSLKSPAERIAELWELRSLIAKEYKFASPSCRVTSSKTKGSCCRF